MGNILSVVESKGKRKPLDSDLNFDSKKRARVVRPDEEEVQIDPSLSHALFCVIYKYFALVCIFPSHVFPRISY